MKTLYIVEIHVRKVEYDEENKEHTSSYGFLPWYAKHFDTKTDAIAYAVKLAKHTVLPLGSDA